MSTPWFFDLLGLPAHADERAVRRAYAIQLKRIDQATDPDGFARLRAAYEAARQWAADADDDVTVVVPVEPSPDATPPDDEAPPAPDTPDVPTIGDPRGEALQRIEWFASTVPGASSYAIRQTLDTTISALRMQYIDAPGLFEDFLVDRLAWCTIDQRPTVFAIASDAFHWQEIGHLAAMGPRGQWIESVEAQSLAWHTVLPVWRTKILATIEAACNANRPLPLSIVRLWPDVRDAFAGYPAYLGLHIAHDLRNEWAAAFDALPGEQRSSLDASAKQRARKAAQKASRQGRRQYGYAGVLLAIVIAIRGVMALHDASSNDAARQTQEAQVRAGVAARARSKDMPIDPRTCHALFQRLAHRPPSSAATTAENPAINEQANRCHIAGEWWAGDTTTPIR